ncbi:ABC transporter permease [Streptomyces sp. NPDC091292]|uniref:ABC transporter permease n=1 Tax=Streptomyces sp. NPDC091292 TaxID=3365991 RepID=UPI0038171CEE
MRKNTDNAATRATQKPPGRRTPARSAKFTVAVWLSRVLIVVVVIGGWQLLASNEYWQLLLGRPSDVASRVGQWLVLPEFWDDLEQTVLEALAGYALGVAVAVALVALILPLPSVSRFLAPYIAIANSLPKVALAPVFIIWFGISFNSKVYFVASAMFFIVFYGVHSGLRNIDRVYLDYLRLAGASILECIRDVYVPAIAGWLMTSLRVSAAWALTAAVISEYIASNSGLGNRIAVAQQGLDPNAIVAGILAVATLAIVADRVLFRVERRFSAWKA